MTDRATPAAAWLGRIAADAAPSDRDLLQRFAAGDEAAFAAVVARHGRLVFAACRRLLPSREDAEDACQATFLILARKAGAVRWRGCVANWLYATARRVAAKARRAAARRAAREAAAAVPETTHPLDAVTGRELLAILDDELGRLPARYREPLVLCHLDGLSRDEAAARLGLPPATVKTRLERGRRRLAAALAGRGISAGAALLALAATTTAAVPPRLADAICAAAAGAPSPAAAALAAEGWAVGRVLAAVAVSALALGAVWGGPAPAPQPQPEPRPAANAQPPPADAKFLADVAAARKKAVRFLTERQAPNGRWGAPPLAAATMIGGETALAALALLEAGVPPTDPALAKAVAYLAPLPPRHTYVVGLQTRVLARAAPKAHAARLQANADWLVARGVGLAGGRLDGWTYQEPAGLADGSNTHFAVFGLHAAATAGAKVDPDVWAAVRDLYVRTYRPGGWAYTAAAPGATPTYAMTAAAVAGLAVADRHVAPTPAGRDAADAGLRALLGLRDGRPTSVGYNWLVTAELGRALGTTTFRAGPLEMRWYREGAEKLIADQRPEGSWVPGTGIDADPVLGTAFGLYFLGPP